MSKHPTQPGVRDASHDDKLAFKRLAEQAKKGAGNRIETGTAKVGNQSVTGQHVKRQLARETKRFKGR